MSISPTSPLARLSQIATASAQSAVNYRLELIDNQLTAQLNKKIAALQATAQNPAVPGLEQQAADLTKQQAIYTKAEAQASQNGVALGDLSLQLGKLAVAGQGGDSTTFDQSLSAINTDIGILQPLGYTPGLQNDGIAALQANGIGIQSSASYNLSTPAGQALAASDIQAAQAAIQNITGISSTNQTIASSIQQALQGQISNINNEVDTAQTGVLATDAQQIAKLKQQEQEQFHLIELALGSVGTTTTMIQSFETSGNTAPPPGSVISIMLGSSAGEPTLPVANITTSMVSTTA
ncbi:MAG TPA: hypothetical protein VLX85_07620 [Stellaceae bacterium]|nr:hypothetical protein [Stellaceae bacterium]